MGRTTYQTSHCEVPAPSLTGNLLGDDDHLQVWVLTPTDGGPEVRRPTIYVLAGYTEAGGGMASLLATSAAPTDGSVSPIIVVTQGLNAFGGSFYVNSPVTGGWEDAIVTDLVGFVDANFPTIARPESRGISGSSMGGFGAFNLAMLHPEVFGAVYALSPGLFDPDGAQARLGQPGQVERVLTILDEIAGMDQAAALEHIRDEATGETRFEWAYGLAFAPDPESPALIRFPFHREGDAVVRDDALWATWEAGFGGLPAELDRYGDNLRQLSGIGIDYGLRDGYAWIPDGCAYTSNLLRSAGIDVVEAIHEGGHTDRISERLIEHMLPFMAERLSTATD